MKPTKEEKALKAKAEKEAEKSEQVRRDDLLSGIKLHLEQLLPALASDDSRRDFLTEIFCLTEDLRYELSESETDEEEMQSDESALVPCGAIADEKNSDSEQEGSNEGDGEISECAVKVEPIKDIEEFTSIALRKSDGRKFLYRYLITKTLVKVMDTTNGETEQFSQPSFLRQFKPNKKLNNKNRKRHFMNYGKKRVA